MIKRMLSYFNNKYLEMCVREMAANILRERIKPVDGVVLGPASRERGFNEGLETAARHCFWYIRDTDIIE